MEQWMEQWIINFLIQFHHHDLNENVHFFHAKLDVCPILSPLRFKIRQIQNTSTHCEHASYFLNVYGLFYIDQFFDRNIVHHLYSYWHI